MLTHHIDFPSWYVLYSRPKTTQLWWSSASSLGFPMAWWERYSLRFWCRSWVPRSSPVLSAWSCLWRPLLCWWGHLAQVGDHKTTCWNSASSLGLCLRSRIYLDKIKSKGLRITPLYMSVNTLPLSFVSDFFKDCCSFLRSQWCGWKDIEQLTDLDTRNFPSVWLIHLCPAVDHWIHSLDG